MWNRGLVLPPWSLRTADNGSETSPNVIRMSVSGTGDSHQRPRHLDSQRTNLAKVFIYNRLQGHLRRNLICDT
jgi:hypothetical protein